MASLIQFHQISLAISSNLIKDEEYNLVTLLFLCKQIHTESQQEKTPARYAKFVQSYFTPLSLVFL